VNAVTLSAPNIVTAAPTRYRAKRRQPRNFGFLIFGIAAVVFALVLTLGSRLAGVQIRTAGNETATSNSLPEVSAPESGSISPSPPREKPQSQRQPSLQAPEDESELLLFIEGRQDNAETKKRQTRFASLAADEKVERDNLLIKVALLNNILKVAEGNIESRKYILNRLRMNEAISQSFGAGSVPQLGELESENDKDLAIKEGCLKALKEVISELESLPGKYASIRDQIMENHRD